MSDHATAKVERRCDVVIVGGSATGLAAALQLVRQRRSVIVVDAGEPRNGPAAHLHGYVSRDGVAPCELVDAGRAEVRGYGGEILAGRVSRVSRVEEGHFRVELDGGNAIVARRVVAAIGLVDELPDIVGLAGGWGRGVVHCPFCHGFELRDRRILQIVTGGSELPTAALFRQLTERLTIVLHGDPDVDPIELDALLASGVAVLTGPVRSVVTDDNGAIVEVELNDGERVEADAIAVNPRFTVRAEPFLPLGLRPTPHPSGLGDIIETDDDGATSVAGLYAAGNVTDPGLLVLGAAAAGGQVGAMISAELALEDVHAAARPSANEADWEHRYSGEQMWSGNPNGSLVAEVTGMTPGRALDVGAGEGGDAVWLAQQGWTVTASDISRRALDRVQAHATLRGALVECLHADANSLGAFPPAAFDLVSAHYASIPRTPDARGVHNLIDAVAPGGVLLVVGHDLEPLRAMNEDLAHSRAFDADAYVRTEDVAEVVAETIGWTIEANEKRPRPAGAVSSSHHVEDVVFRARRSSE